MSSYGNLFAEHDAKHTASVLYDTWGHLDAKPGVIYPCTFYVANEGRECLVIKDTCSLGGPGYYYDVNTFTFNKIVKGNKPEGVYYFEGTYQMYKKRPKDAETIGYFKGRITEVRLPK